MIPFIQPLLPATFLRRDNRFRASLLLGSEEIAAHVANSGRLGELLVPGARCYVSEANTAGRITSHDLRLVEYGGVLVSIDSRLPNDLFAEALAKDQLPRFQDFGSVRREVTLGQSRLDFLLVDGSAGKLWVETKSVTLVERGIAMFPDAPTLRGRKHLAELEAAVVSGDASAVVFVVQRGDAQGFSPHRDADPAFAAGLHAAHRAGVGVYAYRCEVTPWGIQLTDELPVDL